MITSNHNVIDYIVKMPVIMNTFQLLYDYDGKKIFAIKVLLIVAFSN